MPPAGRQSGLSPRELARDALAPGFVHLGFALGSADAVDELTRVIATAGHRVLERPHRTGERGRYEKRRPRPRR
jgi:hypothetical protein